MAPGLWLPRADFALAYGLSVALVVLLAIAGLLGAAFGMDGLHEPYPASLPGLLGQDILSVIGAAPLLAIGLWLARRGSLVGLFLWAGMLFYAAYTYFFMVVGAVTPLLPAYVAIVALGTYGLLALLFRLDVEAVAHRFSGRTPRRWVAGYFLAVVGLFMVLWGGLVSTSLAEGTGLDPVQHQVVAIDLTILLPVLLYAGVQLWRGAASGYVLGGLLLVKTAATSFTLAFNGTLAMLWNAELVASEAVLAVIFGAMAIGALALLVPYLRSAQG